MNDYLKPNKYLIFDAIGLENRVFWNNEIHIGSLMYSMVGVTKYSPGHFCTFMAMFLTLLPRLGSTSTPSQKTGKTRQRA